MSERLLPGSVLGQLASAMQYEAAQTGCDSMAAAAEAAERQIFNEDPDVRILARSVLVQYAISRGIQPSLMTDHRMQ